VKKRELTFALRAIVSAAFIIFLLYKLDIESFILSARTISPVNLLIPFLFYWFTYFLAILRWAVILKFSNFPIPFSSLTRCYLIGFFFNNFVPTGIGGDILRVILSSKEHGGSEKIASSVVIERVLGFIATFLVGLLVSPFSHLGKSVKITLFLLTLASTALTLSFLTPPLKKALKALFSFIPFKVVRSYALSLLNTLYTFRHKRKSLLYGFIFSLLYQTALIYFYFLVGRILGIKGVSFIDYLTFLPIVWAIGVIPVSINAIGVREACFSYFFSKLGQSASLGMFNSLVGFFITVFSSLVGGILFLFGKERKIASRKT